MPFAGVTVNVPEEQIVSVTLAITGVGLTVTSTLNALPAHVPFDGVTE